MSKRRIPVLFVPVLISTLAIGVAFLVWNQEPIIDKIAQSKFAERFYIMEYNDVPLATWETSGHINDNDEWEFQQQFTYITTSNFKLINKQVHRFSRKENQPLVEFSSKNFVLPDSSPYESTEISSNQGTLTLRKSSVNQPVELQTKYSLASFFGLELWIGLSELQQGSEFADLRLDPKNGKVLREIWTVLALSSSSVTVGSTTGVTAVFDTSSKIPQLEQSVDRTGITIELVHDSVFDDLNVPRPSQFHNVGIAMDSPLSNPTRLRLLELSLDFLDDDPGPWSSMLSDNSTLRIERPIQQDQGKNIEQIITSMPKLERFDDIGKLAQSIVQPFDDIDSRVSAMVLFAHNELGYRGTRRPQNTQTTLEDRAGDCSDISNFVTSLATAVGINARTVYGLAYDSATESFRMHAWNEIKYESGDTRNVDATWNQLYADATHIEFPDAFLIEILHSLDQLEMKVVATEYWESI